MLNRLYEVPAGIRLMKVLQLQLALLINQKRLNFNDLQPVAPLFFSMQRVPILSPFLLISMVQLGEVMATRRHIDRQLQHFTNWNLSMLDLENLDDDDCVEALNSYVFRRYFSGHRAREGHFSFNDLWNTVHSMGGGTPA